MIDYDKCKGCGRCIGAYSFDAIYSPDDAAVETLDRKMAEYAMAVLDGRPHFHISLVIDVSPNCDCHPENDAGIVPNIGMFASFDPVALDQACVDAVNAAPMVPNSKLGDMAKKKKGPDHFSTVSPGTNWELQLAHAEKIGLGTRQYELIRV